MQRLRDYITAGSEWVINNRPWSIVIIIVLVLAALFDFGVLQFGWDWTGFYGYPTETVTTTSGNTTTIKGRTLDKTLWDWLDLIIIPAVLAVGAFLFNRAQRQREERAAKDREEERTLQHYLDEMTELLLEKDLRNSEQGAEVRSVARAQTMTVLPTLNNIRKASVLRFLYEAGLIKKQENIATRSSILSREVKPIAQPIIDLVGANLSEAYLSGAYLPGANLYGTNLRDANLSFAKLDEADLSFADLDKANLYGTSLDGARLDGANLRETKLYVANLRGANLSGADLNKANLSGTDLYKASLEGAKLVGTNLSMTNLNEADLSEAKLTGAKLRKADLSEAKLLWANLSEASLSGAKLDGANLREANLFRAILDGANLRGTNLREADLSETNLRGAYLREAKYDDDTTFPEGFDPVKAGAVYEPVEDLTYNDETDD